jgi:hypothetical protein
VDRVAGVGVELRAELASSPHVLVLLILVEEGEELG